MTTTIGNLGARVDLKVVRGVDVSVAVNVTRDGAAEDLTGYSATLVVKSHDKSATNLLSKTPTVSSGGTVTITIADTDTATVSWNQAVYYLNIISGAGVITRIMDGAFTLVYGSDDDE